MPYCTKTTEATNGIFKEDWFPHHEEFGGKATFSDSELPIQSIAF